MGPGGSNLGGNLDTYYSFLFVNMLVVSVIMPLLVSPLPLTTGSHFRSITYYWGPIPDVRRPFLYIAYYLVYFPSIVYYWEPCPLFLTTEKEEDFPCPTIFLDQ